MVYGSATFMGVPWETIIKIYRKELSTRSFDTIDEYVKDFFCFLTEKGKEYNLFPESKQDEFAKATNNQDYERREIKP